MAMVGNERDLDHKMDTIAVFDQAMNATTPCTAAWEEVGLSCLRQGLDEQAMAIAENQESSLQRRKALATQAKSFRATVDQLEEGSEIRASGGALVRVFKSEIDALTTRSRFAENAFLNLYKLLREAPDPAVTIQSLTQAARAAVETLEERIRALVEQNVESMRQLEALRAAAATARSSSLTAEELQEERRTLRVELAAEQAEKEQLRLQALQDAVQEELLHAQHQAEQERAAGQAQLQVLQGEVERLEMRAALFEEAAGRTGQLEDEARVREEQLQALRDQVSSLESSKKTLLVDVAAAEAAEKEAIVTLSEVQIQFRNSEQFLGNRVKDLEEEGTRLKQEVTMGADAVEVRTMREKIRILEGIWGDDTEGHDGGTESSGATSRRQQELLRPSPEGSQARGGRKMDDSTGSNEHPVDANRVLTLGQAGKGTRVETGDTEKGGDNETADQEENDEHRHHAQAGHRAPTGRKTEDSVGEHEEGEGGCGDEGVDEERGRGIDAWLISYNARLKRELERLRVRTRQAEETLREVQRERAAESTGLAEARQDVKRLEQDLVDAHQVVEAGKTMLRAFQSGHVARQFGKLVGRGPIGTGSRRLGGGLGVDEDDTGGVDDLLVTMEGGEVEEGGGQEGAEGFSATDRLLGAVKRQRERFRKEALRREREASIAKGNAEQLAQVNQELRQENVHLYKKIRFLMSYGERGFSSEAGWGGSTAAERATERKYEKLYEDGIDPFKEFDSQEKATRLGKMGLLEKWLFWVSGAVLRNRYRRHALVVYLLVLHILLFLMPHMGDNDTSGGARGMGDGVLPIQNDFEPGVA